MKQDLTATTSRREPPARPKLAAEIVRIGAPLAIVVVGFVLYAGAGELEASAGARGSAPRLRWSRR